MKSGNSEREALVRLRSDISLSKVKENRDAITAVCGTVGGRIADEIIKDGAKTIISFSDLALVIGTQAELECINNHFELQDLKDQKPLLAWLLNAYRS